MAPAISSVRGFLKEVEAVRHQRGRNTLAAWFRAHHDELLEQLGGRQIEWDLYLAVFARRGLKDADGNPPTRNTASKTWQRTRAAIARERARKEATAVPPVSRLRTRSPKAYGCFLPPTAPCQRMPRGPSGQE